MMRHAASIGPATTELRAVLNSSVSRTVISGSEGSAALVAHAPDESITLADATVGLHSFRGVFDAGGVSTVSAVRLDRVGRNHYGLHLAAHIRN